MNVEKNTFNKKKKLNKIQKNLAQFRMLKSVAVQNQLKKLENLVEIYIHLEKCIQTANILPLPDIFQEFCKNEALKNYVTEITKSCKILLIDMIDMDNVKEFYVKEHAVENEDWSKISRFINIYNKNRLARNDILQKWVRRTSARSDKPVSNVNKMTEDSMQNNANILNQSRTLNVRNQKIYSLFPKLQASGEKLYCPDIYNDTDFYLSLLHEVIELKSHNIQQENFNNKINTFNMTRQRMKRSSRLKASKGRQIRFISHPKLINYMTVNSSLECQNSQQTILYQSLFSS